jgi:hypothetical protein
MSKIINYSLGLVRSLARNSVWAVIIASLALLILAGSILVSGKMHNCVERFASQIINKETGIDVDALLPPD